MNVRYRVTLFLFVFGFLMVIGKLFYWQVVRAEELSQMGQTQYGRNIRLLPQRGEIKTADGFAIAANKISYLVFANPKEIKDKDYVVNRLAKTLSLDIASVSATISQDRFWVAIKNKVDNKTKEEVEKLKLPGVGFEEQYVRFYPEASMAAQLIGFVGKDDLGEDKGYFGLEGYYERQLKGKVGIATQIHDAFGRPILARINNNATEINGRTLSLTIDRTLQYILEKKLKYGIDTYGAAGGMAAVLDPKTGNILAMASFPSFDPRSFAEFDSSLYRNPFISNEFEPGSTFKALIMASAIDAGAVTPEEKCPICEGPVEIGGYSIKTWNGQYRKNISMIETIQHSDNIGMVYVSQQLGLERMMSYIKKFGIGQRTGIDLQGESVPNIRPSDSWYPIDVATASFGQGITVTPIELLMGFASIANEGQRMEPHLVSGIQTAEGETIQIAPKVIENTISPKTAKAMTEILVNAVDQGEAKFAKPKGYRIAGKTGTAQIPVAGHYDPNETIASFIGFAPADDPKFAMLVIIDRPTTSIYGAETAAPIFFDIAKDLFIYYKISPT